MSIGDISESAAEKRCELDKLCWIEDGWIRLSASVHYKYDIELSRICTYEKLVWWTRHLAGKPWMTLPVLRYFIRLVCEHHGLEFRGSL